VSALNPQFSIANGGQVEAIDDGWRLSLPAGEAGSYRLAQLDDYQGLARGDFPHRAPVKLRLRARISSAALPGTWGFGLWNEPLSAQIGFGSGRKLPALPNAAWYFFASPENHLALRDDMPGHGALAASFRSPRWPAPLLALGLLAAPLLLWRPASRLLRRATSRVVQGEARQLQLDPIGWHEYGLNWCPDGLQFKLDGQVIHRSSLSPQGPLGLVLWLDNQYAAWRRDGSLAYGALANPAAWLEICDLSIN
jgi:hypothetical protein